MPRVDLLLTNVGRAVLFKEKPAVGRSSIEVLRDVEVAAKDGIIVAVGQRGSLRGSYEAREVIDAGGRLLTPGLVDMHTHALFAGARDDELEMKLSGVPYAEILRRGGGIYRTVRATRSAPDEELASLLASRLSLMLRLGTTTVEVKSGYGLELAEEERLLKGHSRCRRQVACKGSADALSPRAAAGGEGGGGQGGLRQVLRP